MMKYYTQLFISAVHSLEFKPQERQIKSHLVEELNALLLLNILGNKKLSKS